MSARDSLEKAADTAEAFRHGRESGNEDLMREMSGSDAYDVMAERQAGTDRESNEHANAEDVGIAEVKGDRAVAKATCRRFSAKVCESADAHRETG